jgi:putative membrane protein
LPGDLAGRWNLDPWLLAVLAGAAALFVVRVLKDDPGTARWRSTSFAAGWLVLALVFVSPFCALGSALFSARVLHHVLLVAAAAPLLALARPLRTTIHRGPARVAAALVTATALTWFWHAPGPYAAALSSHGVFWAMEASLFGSALIFWRVTLSAAPALPGGAALALLGMVVQMGMLGALLTFAPEPLYFHHLATTAPWGLTALEDQQLAGLIMWIPAAAPYMAAALALVGRDLFASAGRHETAT